MKRFLSVIILIGISHYAFSFIEKDVKIKVNKQKIYGTLCKSENQGNWVALIIAGSGPTDRNGNNPLGGQNNSLKMLSQQLADNGITNIRYDKRAIGESKVKNFNESDLRFDHYVEDAKQWIEYLKEGFEGKQIVVIGHSEGALIGAIAAKNEAQKFVSLAGTSLSADQIIINQINQNAPALATKTEEVFKQLRKGEVVKNVDPMLQSIFRPSVQPYIISWMQYNPVEEYQKLKIPILIVQGGNDIQVDEKNGEMFKAELPKSKYLFLASMNHILKKINGDMTANLASYSNPTLDLQKGLIEGIISFCGD